MIYHSILMLVLCVAVAGLSRRSAAQDGSRQGTFEIGGAFQWFSGQTIDGSIEGVPGDLQMDDVFAGGIHFGYNLTDQFNLNTDFVFGQTDLSFANADGRISDEADVVAWTVNVEYYILPTAFSPFVNVGIGIFGLENEYESDGWYHTHRRERELPVSEVNFLWNVGGGLRWDPIEHLYLKIGYRLNGTELDYSDEYMLMHSVLFTAGYSFGK